MSRPALMYWMSAWQMTTSSGVELLWIFWCHSSQKPPCSQAHSSTRESERWLAGACHSLKQVESLPNFMSETEPVQDEQSWEVYLYILSTSVRAGKGEYAGLAVVARLHLKDLVPDALPCLPLPALPHCHKSHPHAPSQLRTGLIDVCQPVGKFVLQFMQSHP